MPDIEKYVIRHGESRCFFFNFMHWYLVRSPRWPGSDGDAGLDGVDGPLTSLAEVPVERPRVAAHLVVVVRCVLSVLLMHR